MKNKVTYRVITEGEGLKSSNDEFKTKKEAIQYMARMHGFMIDMEAYMFSLQRVEHIDDDYYVETVITRYSILGN